MPSELCSIPGCDREVTNKTRQLCSRCVSSQYYWNKRLSENRDAAKERIERLNFLTGRMQHWFYAKKRKR